VGYTSKTTIPYKKAHQQYIPFKHTRYITPRKYTRVKTPNKTLHRFRQPRSEKTGSKT
jgi:hypothetical protein